MLGIIKLDLWVLKAEYWLTLTAGCYYNLVSTLCVVILSKLVVNSIISENMNVFKNLSIILRR